MSPLIVKRKCHHEGHGDIEQEGTDSVNGVERDKYGEVDAGEAAQVLAVSLRQVRRILAAYRKESAAALAHGNRGRRPHNALDDEPKKRVLDLAQSTYAGCNTQHFTELLAEREGIAVSPDFIGVRLILLRAGWEEPSQETTSQTSEPQGALPQGRNPDKVGTTD